MSRASVRFGFAVGAVPVALIGALSFVECRDPTEITVRITSDTCPTLTGTGIAVGPLDGYDDGAFSAVQPGCAHDGYVGSIVVIPSGSSDTKIGIKVVGAIGKDPATCTHGDPKCIVARRSLGFVPHTRLTLPIALETSCAGVACDDPTTTCAGGNCVPAAVDPNVCASGDCSLDGGAHDAGSDAADSESSTDAAPPPMVSCATSGDGRTNCGSGSESCCTSLPVTGGTYNRTYTNTGSGPTAEADPATVSDFRLDKYEVTVGRFRQFVVAWNSGSGWTPPAASGKHTHLNGGSGLAAAGGGYEAGWATSDNNNIAPTNGNLACDASYQTWTPSAGGQEKLPTNCVSWYEAAAFCIWDGGFLPSEAEWEYAAAGGSAEREYPWGATAPGTSNQYAIYGCYYPSSSGSCTNVSSIAPVGTPTAGAGKYGQLDLAGNVWEWNVDWYAAYAACTNCTNATSSYRVGRGGGFNGPASSLLPPNRSSISPTGRYSNFGFRCARTP